MTNEDLYGMCPSEILDEFFESNVCIPKGENRHPDADILHRVAEDITVEHEISGTNVPFGKLSIPLEIYYKALVSNDKWFNCWMVASSRFRIKPSEPVYEWQWYGHNRDLSVYIVRHGKYMTELELTEYKKSMEHSKDLVLYRFEHGIQVRK